MHIQKALKNAQAILKSAHYVRESVEFGLERPRIVLESELLLCFVLQKERVFLHAHSDDILSPNELRHFFQLIWRRFHAEPIEYITKRVSFYGRDFFIQHGALIPRCESEILIEKTQEIITHHKITQIAEVGIGSGVISITLLLHNPQLRIFATDISKEALEVTSKNIARFGLGSAISIFHGEFLEPLTQRNLPIPELIIANLPYIPNGTKLPLPLQYEPQTALFGGTRGTEAIEELLRVCKKHGVKFVVCEMGFDQKALIHEIAKPLGYKKLEFYKDLSNHDRGFSLYFE